MCLWGPFPAILSPSGRQMTRRRRPREPRGSNIKSQPQSYIGMSDALSSWFPSKNKGVKDLCDLIGFKKPWGQVGGVKLKTQKHNSSGNPCPLHVGKLHGQNQKELQNRKELHFPESQGQNGRQLADWRQLKSWSCSLHSTNKLHAESKQLNSLQDQDLLYKLLQHTNGRWLCLFLLMIGRIYFEVIVCTWALLNLITYLS